LFVDLLPLALTCNSSMPDPLTGPTLLVAALAIGSRDPSAVEITAPTPAVRLGPELPLKLHQAPDPGAVGADVRLNLGGYRGS
jgi:hypothetical protein